MNILKSFDQYKVKAVKSLTAAFFTFLAKISAAYLVILLLVAIIHGTSWMYLISMQVLCVGYLLFALYNLIILSVNLKADQIKRESEALEKETKAANA